MKKIAVAGFALLMLCGLSACSNSTDLGDWWDNQYYEVAG
jgi:hypothetical protein